MKGQSFTFVLSVENEIQFLNTCRNNHHIPVHRRNTVNWKRFKWYKICSVLWFSSTTHLNYTKRRHNTCKRSNNGTKIASKRQIGGIKITYCMPLGLSGLQEID